MLCLVESVTVEAGEYFVNRPSYSQKFCKNESMKAVNRIIDRRIF